MAEPAGADRPCLVALTSDVMLSVRIEEAARAAGHQTAVAASVAQFDQALSAGEARLVLLDLADPAFSIEETMRRVQRCAQPPVLLAFFPHVRKDLETRARAAGCGLIMPRSRFLLDLPEALRLGFAIPSRAQRAAELSVTPREAGDEAQASEAPP